VEKLVYANEDYQKAKIKNKTRNFKFYNNFLVQKRIAVFVTILFFLDILN